MMGVTQYDIAGDDSESPVLSQYAPASGDADYLNLCHNMGTGSISPRSSDIQESIRNQDAGQVLLKQTATQYHSKVVALKEVPSSVFMIHRDLVDEEVALALFLSLKNP